MLLESFLDSPFCIYGAGIIAASIYTAIKTLYNKEPLFFLVSDAAEGKADENPVEIDGIAIKRLSEWKDELRKLQSKQAYANNKMLPDSYLVATPIVHQESIRESLHALGVKEEDILLLTNELENEIMETYYSSLDNGATALELLAAGKVLPESPSAIKASLVIDSQVQVFQAKCHVDRLLQSQDKMPEYVVPIQVGTVFADKEIAAMQDNQGENISKKNRNYCELTATYYAWKHSQAAYKGLCHYRRVFDISEEQMQNLLRKEQEWDVILPYPSIHYPDISSQHTRYIKKEDWQAMLQALQEVAPEYLEAYEKLLLSGEQCFYNYNMLIAKAAVFDDYCSFLFRVLARTEELTTPKGWERADRFAGYMGENLTTLYFHKNRKRWKIVYAGKKWLI